MTALLFNHLWQSTLFAGVIAILALALRHHRKRLRDSLWLAASVKCLVPFAVLAAAGGVFEWRQAPAPIKSMVASPGIRDFNAPFAAMSVDSTATVAAAAQPHALAPLLVALWACGFTTILLRRVWQWRGIRAAARASTPFATLPPAPAEIRTAPTVLEPGVVGLRRPVVLPEGIDSYLTARQFAAVLAHEVCHVQRRDNLTAALHMLVEAVFWFHPLVWWVGARLVATREQACDEHVVAETAEPIAYADGIVSVCRRYMETPLMNVSGVGGADVKARIDAILSNRIGLRLTLPKRLVLATAAVAAFVAPLAAGAINHAVITLEQVQGATPGRPPVDPEARFEVVSIKRFDASTGAPPRISITPGRYDVAGLPLSPVVAQAVGVPADRMFGLPDWVNTELYTIAAKAPDGPPPPAIVTSVMLANMLKDRFRLAMHRETRELPVYDLVFARNDKRFGAAIKPTSPECLAAIAARVEGVVRSGVPAPLADPGGCLSARITPDMVSLSGVPMAMIAQILTQSVGRPVIDKTGLTGYYDFALKWTPQPGSGMPFTPAAGGTLGAPPPAPDPDAPNLFTAVQEQLGLRLEAGRGPVEVVVIDRLEKPTLD